MPLIANGPAVIEVRNDNVFNITGIHIHVESMRIDLVYAYGYIGDVTNENDEVVQGFIPTGVKSLSLTGDSFYAIALAMPNASLNFYDNLKTSLYLLIMDKEGVTGTIA